MHGIKQYLAALPDGSLTSMAKLHAEGFSQDAVDRRIEKGELVRFAGGVYSVRSSATSANQDVVAVALHAPDVVFCLFTALEIHELRAPGADIWVAIPAGSRKPKVADISIEAVYPSAQSLGFGVVPVTRDGVTLKVTDLAKTVADCFNFRRRVGLDVALDALRAARLERGVSVDDLWRSAEAAGADGFMRPYLEVIA
jgi:predicted transcriptional regulator of viral defense system